MPVRCNTSVTFAQLCVLYVFLYTRGGVPVPVGNTVSLSKLVSKFLMKTALKTLHSRHLALHSSGLHLQLKNIRL